MFWVCTLVFQVSKPGKKCWKLGHGCRGDKKLERSKYMNVPAGRQGQASPHTRLRTRTETFCKMGVVGWNGGYITG